MNRRHWIITALASLTGTKLFKKVMPSITRKQRVVWVDYDELVAKVNYHQIDKSTPRYDFDGAKCEWVRRPFYNTAEPTESSPEYRDA